MIDKSKLERPHDLPQWEHPPLDEVAIAIQFADIPGFKIVHYGQLADRLGRLGLSMTEDKNTIAARFEVFGKTPVEPVQIHFQAVDAPLPRVWYMSDDKHKLAQVQPDRLVYNWRKVEGEGIYPRLKVVLPEFWESFMSFQDFLNDLRFPPLAINQCELSYFNNIAVEEQETYDSAFARVFRFWSGRKVPLPLKESRLELEQGNFSMSYILRTEAGTPLARVHASAAPAKSGAHEVIRLSIVFRGPWSGQDDSALVQFFALGREAIVKLFDSLITDDMHIVWGRHFEPKEGASL